MAKKKNNNLWFVLGGIIIAVLIIWIIAANVNNDVICNAPHIKVGNSCCLDENSNGICDGDEEPKKLQTYCGDGICQSDEDYNSCSDDCEPSPSKMVGIRAFDYDKDEKRITILQIEDPNHYPDWTLNAKGYGSDGNLKFEKDVQMDCYGFYSDYYCSGVCTDCRVSDIPYLEGGTLSIKALSGDATVQAIGDYSYSTFDSEISFDVEFNSYDGDEDEFIYEITNTGKRIIIVDSIVGILFIDECGDDNWQGGDWVARGYLDVYGSEDEIISPSETVKARGLALGSVYDIRTFCTKFEYKDNIIKKFVFEVI